MGGGESRALAAETDNTTTDKYPTRGEGKIVASGEDGVPWEFYENGYLLFKPVPGKNILAPATKETSWKKLVKTNKLISIGFSDKVYTPENSQRLFNLSDFEDNTVLKTPLKFIEGSKLDTSKTKRMDGMFLSLQNLEKLDVSNWDTSNVISMSDLFNDTRSLKFLDVSRWNTQNVQTMDFMFAHSGIEIIDVSRWNTSNLEDIAFAFNGTNLKSFDANNWNTNKLNNMQATFSASSSLKTIKIGNWNTHNVTDMSFLFSYTTNLEELDISNWNTSNVTNMSAMFAPFSHIVEYDDPRIENTSLKKLDLSKWNTSKVTNMSRMFEGLAGLTELKINNFDTRNVTDMSKMFRNVSSLKNLDIGNWNTEKLENAYKMFEGMSGLTTLNINGLNLRNVIPNRDSSEHYLDDDPKNTEIYLTGYADDRLLSLKEITISDKLTPKKGQIEDTFKSLKYNNNFKEIKWKKKNTETEGITSDELYKEYTKNPKAIAGTWVRDEISDNQYRLTFNTGTSELIKPLNINKDSIVNLPTPNVDKLLYKFLGWSKTENGAIISEKVNIIEPGKTQALYAKWEKVNNVRKRKEIIPISIKYENDDQLEIGVKKETPGLQGEKEIITTFSVAPITGELTNPKNTENIIKEMKPKIIKVGTKQKVTYEKDGNNIVKKTVTYNVNPENGEVKENTKSEVFKNNALEGKTEPKVTYEKDGNNIVKKTVTYNVNPENGEVKEEVMNKIDNTNNENNILNQNVKIKSIIKSDSGDILETLYLEKNDKPEIRGYKYKERKVVDKNTQELIYTSESINLKKADVKSGIDGVTSTTVGLFASILAAISAIVYRKRKE